MESSILAVRNIIEGFKLSCQTEGKSPKTIEWYITFLNRFYQFLEQRNLPTDLSQIDKNHIREFIRYLQTEARTPYRQELLSEATVQGYIRTLKAFYSWATREEYIDNNPMVKISVPRASTKVINTFSPEQITKLSTVCQQECGNGCRNLTMLLLMLDCGPRVSEVININLEDVNLEEGYIKIRAGKGGKERLIPVGSFVLKMLWKYINQSRPKPITGKVTSLFLSNDGLPLTRSGVHQMIRRYLQYTHKLRVSPFTWCVLWVRILYFNDVV